jgi:predicted DNA-binding transcriptional regulator AlpA|tara:strand:+ start:560 stop:733 length:174 start_codon:yes stop_codon:yes gene_type:complete
MENSLISTIELCSRLGVTRQAVYKWRKEGMPVEIKHERTIRYSWTKVKKWLNQYKGR